MAGRSNQRTNRDEMRSYSVEISAYTREKKKNDYTKYDNDDTRGKTSTFRPMIMMLITENQPKKKISDAFLLILPQFNSK